MRTWRSLKLPLLVAAAVLAMALIGAAALGTNASTPATSGAVAERPHVADDHTGDSAHQKPALTRTLALYTDAEPAPSAHAERMRALLIKGKLPGGVLEATVVTDEDCAPDANGVSHCRNRLRLPSGRTITVRHPHRMADVPCMTPGETVRVRRAVDA